MKRKQSSMILNRTEQFITIEGQSYSPEDIHCLVSALPADTSAILRDLYLFLDDWFSESTTMMVHTSGSTGTPKELIVRKEQMMQSARMSCEAFALRPGETALLCMPLQYIAGKMMVVRALVGRLNLIVRTPSGHPLVDVKEHIRFAAMVPLQVYNTLESAEEQERLRQIDVLIIGGGMINPHFARKLALMPNKIYMTYGMTETLSHIALCRLTGRHTDRITYYPLPGVKLSLSVVGTLVIHAPLVCDEVLTTNDVASIMSDDGFVIEGRLDTIINSGGIKMQPEMMEGWLQNGLPMPFAFTSIPDALLGEAVVLLVEGTMEIGQIRSLIEAELPSKYARPKWIVSIEKIPMTGSGKIDRVSCKELAGKILYKSRAPMN